MNQPDLENLLKNETRDARVNCNNTKDHKVSEYQKGYWLARYGAYYEILKIYQIYKGKEINKTSEVER